MKKILLIAAVAGLAMVSCKKDYDCECTTTGKIYQNGVTTTSGPTTSTVKTGKMKKAEAKTKCEEPNGTTMAGNTTNGVSSTVECKIKE